MNISDRGIEFIKSNEGCVLRVYLDVGGTPTSGYGHTKGLTMADVGKVITQAEADKNLKEDLQRFVEKVMYYDPIYHWSQNELDALTSFAFNIGNIHQLTANGTRSKSVIANKILEYNKVNKKVVAGLTKRREAERKLFLEKESPIKEYSLAKDGETKVSEHFKVKEFKCKDGSDSILIDVDFVRNFLEKIRAHFGKPVIINSAYRTPTYNRKVGGAINSYHMKGQAFDIVIKDVTPSEVCRYAKSIGVKGVIRYNTFSHVDSRESTYYAINDGKTVTKVVLF